MSKTNKIANMNPLDIKDTNIFCQFLQIVLGYSERPKNGGSHRPFVAEGRPTVCVPNHREMARGTARQVLQTACGEDYPKFMKKYH